MALVLRASLALTALATALSMAACEAPPDGTDDTDPGEDTSEAASPIEGGSLASDFFSSRTASLGGCTATQIAPRFLLTAAHCQAHVGDAVRFYGNATTPDPATQRTIEAVFIRAGVHPPDDLEDTNGDFADFAVLRLSSAFNAGNIATMAWEFPAEGSLGTKVGQGEHNGDPNPSHLLKMVNDHTSDSSDAGGDFHTENDSTNSGDSGGGFFVDGKVVGDLWGWVRFADLSTANKYTSTPYFLNRILDDIDFQWNGSAVGHGAFIGGHVIDSFLALGEPVCQYACTKTSACVAYDYLVGPFGTCTLLSTITSATAPAPYDSAVK